LENNAEGNASELKNAQPALSAPNIKFILEQLILKHQFTDLVTSQGSNGDSQEQSLQANKTLKAGITGLELPYRP
jgi:hypothetical protein